MHATEWIQVTLPSDTIKRILTLAAVNNCTFEQALERLILAAEDAAIIIPTDPETATMFQRLAKLEMAWTTKPTTALFGRLVQEAARVHQLERIRHGAGLAADLPAPTLA